MQSPVGDLPQLHLLIVYPFSFHIVLWIPWHLLHNAMGIVKPVKFGCLTPPTKALMLGTNIELFITQIAFPFPYLLEIGRIVGVPLRSVSSVKFSSSSRHDL
jgi:hypothetical protein